MAKSDELLNKLRNCQQTGLPKWGGGATGGDQSRKRSATDCRSSVLFTDGNSCKDGRHRKQARLGYEAVIKQIGSLKRQLDEKTNEVYMALVTPSMTFAMKGKTYTVVKQVEGGLVECKEVGALRGSTKILKVKAATIAGSLLQVGDSTDDTKSDA
jgi:hypothetical protein